MTSFIRFVRRSAAALLLILAGSTIALEAEAAGKVGIVLMHGEQGAPGRVIDGLAQALEKGGYLVGRPDMCWSARRSYEAPFDECLAAIDDAIVKLRNLGATSIVVGGFSLGGDAAIAYGADHRGLLGVIALAPAHDARALSQSVDVAESVAKARQLVASGKGDEPTSLSDVAFGPNGAYTTEVSVAPTVYLSFFGASSPASIPENARRLTAPLLWVSGADDPTQRADAGRAFAGAPRNPFNRYVVVSSGHQDTPDKSKDAVLKWLKDLDAD